MTISCTQWRLIAPSRFWRRIVLLSFPLILCVVAFVNAQPAAPAASGQPVADAALKEEIAQNPFARYMSRPEREGVPLAGTDVTLDDLLHNVVSPQERFRLTDQYWVLTEKLIRCNLASIYSNDIEACIGRYQGAQLPQSSVALWVSARRIAEEERRNSYTELLEAQYRLAELSQQTIQSPSQLPIPVNPPTAIPYNTRAEEIARTRAFSPVARALSYKIPNQFEAFSSYENAVDESLAAFTALYKAQGSSDDILLAALERHTSDKREMLSAAIAYNRSIAAYVAETVDSKVQGERLLRTMNQLPSSSDLEKEKDLQAANTPANTIPRLAMRQAPVEEPTYRAQDSAEIPSFPRNLPVRMTDHSSAQNLVNSPQIMRPEVAEPVSPAPLPMSNELSPPSTPLPSLFPEIPTTKWEPSGDELIIRGQEPDDFFTDPLADIPTAVAPVPTQATAPPAQTPPTDNPLPETSPEPATPPAAVEPQAVAPPQFVPQNPVSPPQGAVQSVAPSSSNAAATEPVNAPQNYPPQTVPSALPEDLGGAVAPKAVEEKQPAGIASEKKSQTARTEEESVAASQNAIAIAQHLYAIKSNRSGASVGDENIVEIPLSLEDALSYLSDTRKRLDIVENYWHLRTLIASLSIESEILRTAETMYAELEKVQETTPEYTALLMTWRSFLNGAQARMALLRGDIRSEQVLLMVNANRSPEVGWPIPSSFPCCGPYRLESGSVQQRNFTLLTESVLIPEKIDTLWSSAEQLGAKEGLFLPEVSGVGSIDDAYLYLRTLDNKRRAALSFLDDLESLNNSIARYVNAFSATPLSTPMFVRCLIGEKSENR